MRTERAGEVGCPEPKGAGAAEVRCAEGGYSARLVPASEVGCLAECERLRYDYFVQRRGWVTPDPLLPCRERDRYDAHAQHLAVFNTDEASGTECVAAYLRVLDSRAVCGFMLHQEFAALLHGGEQPSALHRDALQDAGAVELSRLVLASQDGQQFRSVMELLLKLLYHTSQQRGWSRFYIVVEAGWPTLLKRRFGLPFQVLGPPYVFPDGTKTVAALATLADLEAAMAQRSDEKLRWYRERAEDCR